MVLLVWGRRWYGRKLGYVADFCEICRKPQPFQLERKTLIGHFWYIPLGEHHATLHRATCRHCDTTIPIEVGRYASIGRKVKPTRELLAATFPNLERIEQARLDAERLVRKDPAALSLQQRESLIAVPFVVVSRGVEERFAALRGDPVSTAVVGAAIAVAWLANQLVDRFLPEQEEHAFAASFVFVLAVATWQLIVAKRNWVRRTVVPKLARTLAPLQPSRGELERVIAQLRHHDHQLGRNLRADDFFSRPVPRGQDSVLTPGRN